MSSPNDNTQGIGTILLIVLVVYGIWIIYSSSNNTGIYKPYTPPDLLPNQYRPITGIRPLSKAEIACRAAVINGMTPPVGGCKNAT